MVDVHAPHAPIQGWRDLLVHLSIITMGILIALGLEGSFEWLHHRQLVHEAQASLQREISNNAMAIQRLAAVVHQRQADLNNDMTVLRYLVKNGKLPEQHEMKLGYNISSMDDVSWKTAQATGAVSYMSYAQAAAYADIYGAQDELLETQKQAARDAIVSFAPFLGPQDSGADLTPAQGAEVLQKIQIFAAQLQLVDSLISELDKHYRQYLGGKPPGAAGTVPSPG